MQQKDGKMFFSEDFSISSIKQVNRYEEISTSLSRMNMMKDNKQSQERMNPDMKREVVSSDSNSILVEGSDEYTLEDDY